MAGRRDPASIRIFGVAAHIDAGKTTVSERMLFVSGVQFRPGSVDEGTTVMDFEAEERERGITIHSAAINLPWRDHVFTLIDTPGHVDFTAEVERCMRVLDGCVVVLDASKGVEAQTETVWRQAKRHDVVRIAFVNKLDKVGADWDATVASITRRLHPAPVSLQRPWLVDGDIRLVDLVDRRLLVYIGQTADAEQRSEEWPADRRDQWEAARLALVEQVATHDDALLEAFVADRPVTPADLIAAIRRQAIAGTVLPVLGGAALRGRGVEPLLDAVARYLPSPVDAAARAAHHAGAERLALLLDAERPLAAQIFKVVATRHGSLAWVRIYQGSLAAGDQVRNSRTGKVERANALLRIAAAQTEMVETGLAGDVLAIKGLKDIRTGDALSAPKQRLELPGWDFPLPVIAMAVETRKVEDRDRLLELLALLKTEDPTMDYWQDEDTGQLLVAGMGELHLEILANRLQRDFNLDVRLGKPRVAYRETLRQPVRIAGVVTRRLPNREISVFLDVAFEPRPDLDVPVVTDAVPEDELTSAVGRLLRQQAVAALRADLTSGFAHGFPATQVAATIRRLGDPAHGPPAVEDVEATISQLVRDIGRENPIAILEPWMNVVVELPQDYLSGVLGEIQARGGEVHDVTPAVGIAAVRARAPLSRLLDFTTKLRSLTQGRGSAQMALDTYSEVSAGDFARLTGG